MVLVDAKAMWKSQARMMERASPDDYELIDEYARLFRKGADFPPVVINSSGYGGFSGAFLLDGFHRTGAAVKAGRKTIQAVDIGEWVIEFMQA